MGNYEENESFKIFFAVVGKALAINLRQNWENDGLPISIVGVKLI